MMTATKKKKKKRREKEERTTTSEQHDHAHIQAEKARKRGRREKERVRNLCEIAVRPTHTVVADRPARFLSTYGCKYQRSVIAETSGTLRAAGMSNEWDTLSKSRTILLKAARLLALSIHRLSATTSRIFLVDPPLFVALSSIGQLVILNVGDKREKERERERWKETKALSRRVGTGIGRDGRRRTRQS
ncbi:hypothetical protein G5I_08512 [Acromyrmex echinatior]|uniref:Uncharacterized protein n=1 Tax=Acromyrmex echinatior TaxID=103372 RepID=F4WRQ9_ACREC|nr:hypothetical protein G5I_08512 [Acromyrmex echinatior]